MVDNNRITVRCLTKEDLYGSEMDTREDTV